MKVTTLIHWILTAVLTVFAVMYFTHPKKIIERPPTEAQVEFLQTPPDTVYQTTISWRPSPPTDAETIYVNAPYMDTIVVASKATFFKKENDIAVTSIVTAYGASSVMAFDNNINVAFDSERFRESIMASLPKKKSRFVLGVGIGIGVSALTYSIISLSR